ncbi:RDD family protein [Microbacterium sulfonylureivorans]|uniref:RDD family protein n=1 Tax=Microbacterium sulfonylureivorans TaxID=2486854 RepID=UPI000FDB498C|nr:RDD family protein [Microbacterium sulfonylureivorans]
MTTSPPLAAVSASIGRRAGACAIDLAVAYGVGVAFAGVAVGVALAMGAAAAPRTFGLALALALVAAWAGMLAWAVVCTAMQGGRGSVGQRALDLRLLDSAAPVVVGFWRALWRNVVWVLSCAIFVGWFTPLFDATPRRQGWHDSAGGAIVVDMRGTDASPRASARPALAAPPTAAASPALEPHPWFLAPPAHAAPAHAALPPAPLRPVHTPPSPAHAVPAPAPSIAAPAPSRVFTSAPAHAAPAHAAPAHTAPSAVAVAPASAPPAVLIPQVPGPATRPIATTVGRVDQPRTAAIAPPPAQRAALFDDAPVIAVLTWDDGTRMAVYGRTRYGRNPAVEPGIVSVPVRDETLSLSKTHFEIGGDASGAWVADRHSTNGTVLVRDGGRHPLTAGVPTLLRAGDRLELGDRTAIIGTGS